MHIFTLFKVSNTSKVFFTLAKRLLLMIVALNSFFCYYLKKVLTYFCNFLNKFISKWGISSAGRAPHWQCGGQQFKSAMLHHFSNLLYCRFFLYHNKCRVKSVTIHKKYVLFLRDITALIAQKRKSLWYLNHDLIF